MKKLFSLFIGLLFLASAAAQQPYTFAKIKTIWNTHSVPLGPTQDSTWLSVANYWKLGGTMSGQLKYTYGTPGVNKFMGGDAFGNVTWQTILIPPDTTRSISYGIIRNITGLNVDYKVDTTKISTKFYVNSLGFITLSSLTTSLPLTYNNSTGNFSIPQVTSSVDGYLNHLDWTTFNNKQPAGSYITTLTGDGMATGPGSSVFTLSTVNSNIGTWNNVTVNGKGLVTTGSNVSYLTTILGISAGGDLSGTYPNPTVSKINGNLIPVNASGVLTNNGSGILSWIPASLDSGLTGSSTITITNTLPKIVSIPSSVSLAGNPTVPTQPTATNNTTIANTAFVKAQGYVPYTGASSSVNLNNQSLSNVNVLGIGTSSPLGAIQIVSNLTGANRGIISDQYSTYGSAKEQQRRARGTVISPSSITSTDTLASWAAFGYDGTSFIGSGVCHFFAAGPVSTGVVPSGWQLKNTNHLGQIKVALAVDTGQNLIVSGKIIKSGGTSSQFLKADGSIDGTTYSTTTGTVTSVTTGFGINGGTITTSGTLKVDTTKIQTKGQVLYGIDYGIVADGVTDNTSAFNTFMAACKAGQHKGELPYGTIVFLSQPNTIDFQWDLRGKGIVGTVLIRKYAAASDTIGLMNIRACSGVTIHEMAIESDATGSGGCMISVHSTPGYSTGAIVLENMWISTFGSNTQTYTIYMDGSLKTSGAVGVRDVSLKNVHCFGSTSYSAYLKSIVGLSWKGGGIYSAGGSGSLSGSLIITGTSTVPSDYVMVDVVSIIGGINMRFASYCSVNAGAIGSISGVSINDSASVTYCHANGKMSGSVQSNWLTSSYNDEGNLYSFASNVVTNSTSGCTIQSGNIVLTGGLTSLTNASGGTTTSTSSNYLTVAGSTANNSNLPGILIKGSSTLTRYPLIQMNISGQGLSIYGGGSASFTQDFQLFAYNNSSTAGSASYASILFNNTTRFTFQSDGKMGVGGITSPTAFLHLPAGTATAGTAPLKIPAGTNLTSAESGAIENDGTHIYYTSSTPTRYQLDRQSNVYYSHTIFTPLTGGTVNLVNNQYNIINPAGALVAVTLNLPSSPSNNDVVIIKFTQTISTVTYANGTVVDGITAPSAGGMTTLTYDSGTTSWY